MIKNINYDLSTTGVGNPTVLVAVDKKAVCYGFALMFQKVMSELGVESEVMTGKSLDTNHAWNKVKLDGKWYYIDPTLDIRTSDKELSIYDNGYKYFLLDVESMKKDYFIPSSTTDEQRAIDYHL